jgi:hypothetical protein
MPAITHGLRIATAWLAILSAANAQVRQTAFEWRKFHIPEYGTTIEYPAGYFAPVGEPEKGVGKRFESADGRAILSIYSRDNTANDTPSSYLKNNLRIGQAGLGYERVTQSFFAVSVEREGLIYYSRCNFSRRAGRAIHCFDLVYPREEKRDWDRVVTRISLSLRPLEG